VEVAVLKGLAEVMVGATELLLEELVLEYVVVVVVVVIERVDGQEMTFAVEDAP
jgi:hypothetical protein